jgi:hypothetical protein
MKRTQTNFKSLYEMLPDKHALSFDAPQVTELCNLSESQNPSFVILSRRLHVY